jgi:hypothetical protein
MNYLLLLSLIVMELIVLPFTESAPNPGSFLITFHFFAINRDINM